jgi:hypothetical protein
VARTDAYRLAALVLAVFALLLPGTAAADHPSAGGQGPIGAEHQRMHAKIWKAQKRAQKHWRKMTRAQRKRELRRIRRAERRTWVRARAAAGEPSDVGSWASPFVMTTNFKGYAIHAAMLHTGKVLMWGYPIHREQVQFRGNESFAWLWDPSKGYDHTVAVKEVTPVIGGENVSIYCSGMSFLADGRVLLVGGTLTWGKNDPEYPSYTDFGGLDKALIFDPATETWTELPRPNGSHGRWYPTQVLLADGRTVTMSGLSDVSPGGVLNDTLEIYHADTGTTDLLDTPDQRRNMELYPHLFAMPNGKVLLAGPNPGDSAWFDPDPANLADPWTDLPPLASQRIGGNAVLLPEGPAGSTKVAAIGGRPYGDTILPPDFNEQIDVDDASPAWSNFPDLEVPRSYPNTVLLPDRSMVTVGGDDRIANWPVPERAVELYDPVTGEWRTGPSQVETRAYHSTALLLPDGRVLSTGDDLNPVTAEPWDRTTSSPDDTGEIYSPPYLFKGPRPVISSAPGAVKWNVPFGVGTSGDIDEAVLIAPAATTHGNDMNQRLVPLQTVSTHPGGISVQSPPSANVAQPGWYMLFLLNDGVPSIAKWVRLGADAADVPAIPPAPPGPPARTPTPPQIQPRRKIQTRRPTPVRRTRARPIPAPARPPIRGRARRPTHPSRNCPTSPGRGCVCGSPRTAGSSGCAATGSCA